MNVEQIKERVRKNIQHKKKEFIPGQTYITSSGQYFDAEDVANLVECALNEWYAEGKYTQEFDRSLRTFYKHSIRHSVLVNSGSSANLLAVTTITDPTFGQRQALPGDEIITVACGFPTTINPIIQNRLIPVFVDIDINTLLPDMEIIENAIVEGKTKGIILAHPLGNPFAADLLRNICDEYGIWFIEDNCDGLGGQLFGKPLGSFGDIATLSFYPAHHITSLDYEETVILMNRMGRIVINKIGNFVDNVYSRGDKWKCLSFSKDGNLSFREITGVVKHPVSEPLLKVTVQTGRHVTVSETHSLFSMVDGNIQSIETKNLRVGDYIFVPRKYPQPESRVNYVSMVRYKRGSWEPYWEDVFLTEGFARFLGLFVAEGSFNHTKNGNYGLSLTFSSDDDEIEYAKFVADFLQEKFGIKSNVFQHGENSINLVFNDKGLYKFLEECCGHGTSKKKVPWFIFSAEDSIQWEFINGYYDGDGSHHYTYGLHAGYSRDCKTVSKELAEGLFYLLELCGFHPRWSEEKSSFRDFGNRVSKTKRSYSVNFSKDSLVDAKGFRGSHANGERQFGDLSLLKITKMEYVLPTTENVYDLSVDGFENFVGGIGICCHNSGEGGACLIQSPMVKKVLQSYRDWGKDCWCEPGVDNTCGKRFAHKLGDLPEGYDHKYTFSRIGYNLKATDLQASLLVSQLNKLPWFVERRRHNWQMLREGLDKYKKFFRFHTSIEGANPSWFGFLITVKESAPFTRRELIDYLEAHKVGTRLVFGGNLLKQPAYRDISCKVFQELTGTDVIMSYSFWIGVHPSLTDEHISYMLSVFDKFVEGHKR